MQLGQRVRILVSPMNVTGHEFNGDDNVMLVKLTDEGRTNPIRTCQAGVSLDLLDKAKDKVWEGEDAREVVTNCKTAIVILTDIPQRDIMGIMHQVFHQLFPGGKVD